MGVKELWTFFEPIKKHKSIADMRAEKVAIDLSIWIVDSQSIKQMAGVVSKPHLRNLFFRTWTLLCANMQPVFVIEGKAPELKWQTMADRQQVRRGVKTASVRSTARSAERSNFGRVLKECCELLDHMGVAYIHSAGEAEATCAALNACGLVDAVITEDSDVFLYGACTVYRNFTTTKTASVDMYCVSDIEQCLGFSRDHLIAIALLIGCDYCAKGVPGVGKAQALKLCKEFVGVSLLDRMRQWKQMPLECLSQTERQVATKALTVPQFPNEKIIHEFMKNIPLSINKIEPWHRPTLAALQEYCLRKLDWPVHYTLQKALPMVTLYDLRSAMQGAEPHKHCVQLDTIVKTKTVSGVASLEVRWIVREDYIINDESVELCTVEELSTMEQCFPAKVKEFLFAKASKKGQRGKAKKLPSSCFSGSDSVNVVPKAAITPLTDLSPKTSRVSNNSELATLKLRNCSKMNFATLQKVAGYQRILTQSFETGDQNASSILEPVESLIENAICVAASEKHCFSKLSCSTDSDMKSNSPGLQFTSDDINLVSCNGNSTRDIIDELDLALGSLELNAQFTSNGELMTPVIQRQLVPDICTNPGECEHCHRDQIDLHRKVYQSPGDSKLVLSDTLDDSILTGFISPQAGRTGQRNLDSILRTLSPQTSLLKKRLSLINDTTIPLFDMRSDSGCNSDISVFDVPYYSAVRRSLNLSRHNVGRKGMRSGPFDCIRSTPISHAQHSNDSIRMSYGNFSVGLVSLSPSITAADAD